MVRESDQKIFKRHPDDIKVIVQPQMKTFKESKKPMSEYEETQSFFKQLEAIGSEDDSDILVFGNDFMTLEPSNAQSSTEPRRSTRIRKQNSRYFNSEFEC